MTPALRVRVGTTPEDRRDFRFTKPFRIGRVEENDICIRNEYVSRHHVEAVFEKGQWLLRDLQSANGMFVDGQRISEIPVTKALTVRLGIEGPIVKMVAEEPTAAQTPDDVAKIISHYFDPG